MKFVYKVTGDIYYRGSQRGAAFSDSITENVLAIGVAHATRKFLARKRKPWVDDCDGVKYTVRRFVVTAVTPYISVDY